MSLKLKGISSLGSLLALVFVAVTGLGVVPSTAQAAPAIESIHFLIPGGAGGGWDGTARGTGEALTKSGLVGTASFRIFLVAEVVRPSRTSSKPRRSKRKP